jgi:3-hydroxybutyryl-CoA dehydratase
VNIDALRVGMHVERTRLVTEADVKRFADATGDQNPVHLDEAFAATTRFGGRIAHGLLVAGHISAAIAADLPGPGSIYLGQTLKFVHPVKLGDEITVRLEVIEVVQEKARARLTTICRNQAGEVVIEGEATVLVPKA